MTARIALALLLLPLLACTATRTPQNPRDLMFSGDV